MHHLNLTSLSNDSLLSQTKSLASQERDLTAQVLHYLAEIQKRRLFSQMGYPNLFVFCIKYLKYSGGQTQRRIEAMRVIQELPAIEQKIKEGTLSLTNVAQAQGYFRQARVSSEKKVEILESLENKSTRECERTLLKLLPERPVPKEKVRQLTATQTQITLTVSQELLDKLNRLKALLSHKNPHMTQSELLSEMADIALNKLDPLKQKRRGVSPAPEVTKETRDNQGLKAKRVSRGNSQPSEGRYIPQGIKRRVWHKYQGKCGFVGSQGVKCESEHQLEIDHIRPLSMGGKTEEGNLRLFCKNHNQWVAIQALGKTKMGEYLKL